MNQLCGAVAVIPQQLREKLADMFLLNDEEISSFPKLFVKSENLFGEFVDISIVIEGETVCSCGDLFTAFKLLFATYYIFNLAYPDVLKSTLTFFQKGILNIQDKMKKDPKVSRLLTTLLS